MTKNEKLLNNEVVEYRWREAKKELQDVHTTVRLRSCTAEVLESRNYYFLKSYNTIVAFIEKCSDSCYDVLRLVYGYTSTSAQHISKFQKDYGCTKYGCTNFRKWVN